MLSYSQLADLARRLESKDVLAVYLDATELDAVARRSWRRSLSDGLTATRKSLANAAHAERTGFDRAAARLEEAAGHLTDDLGGAPGWVGFGTADELSYWSALDAAPGTSVAWRRGIAVAPYLRLIRDDAKVLLSVVNTREAAVYEWSGADASRVAQLQAHAHVGRAAHMGDAPRDGFHPGTRGTALSDAAHQAISIGRDQLLRDVCAELEGRARPAGWIVLCGNHAMAEEARERLAPGARKRALVLDGSAATLSEAEIVQAAAEGRARLRARDERQHVDELIDRAVGRRRAVLGPERTLDALQVGAAREVYLTPAFFRAHPDQAESVARAALERGAALREVTGAAAQRLDAESQGVAGTLRFVTSASRARVRQSARGG